MRRRVPSHHSLEGSKCGVCFLAVFFQLLTFLASDQLWNVFGMSPGR
ncbi:hypothetical protein L798_12248 [Zootermopsis nevadensis]|uniref:Uncharacterized protein n=1 Tax=Zootermopsis nevadensis TaxID=136037 RepID=A0A067QW60_ZOONE|nr:hypothetical protein L798_12248 [Zootermopsis nevadensis]